MASASWAFPWPGISATAGHDVVVYNRTSAVAAAMGRDVRRLERADAAGGRAQIASSCSPASATTTTSGRSASAKTGPSPACGRALQFIDHTTASATVARELDEAARAQGLAFIDAPVSGGQAGAENGQLTVMCGGDDADFAKAKPVIDAYARSCRLMGPVGAGQLTKMVNQICIAGLVQALSEGVRFAELAGLDPKRVVEVISKGAAQSWQMENRHETMIARKFDFGFAVDWMRKDLAICLDEARRNGASLPVTALVDQFYGEIQAKGGRRLDTSSLISRL